MDHALSPKPQATSRAPSPVPSAVYASTADSRSSPRLPQPRRSSFSTEPDATEQRPLTTQKSFPHLSKKTRKHQEKQSRRASDATTDGSDASFSITAESIALVAPRLLANDKRNHDFHVLFRSVPDGERLIDDYGCALQKEILLQGRVYISENHLCFNANIFGWITNLVIAFADIEEIEKRTTAIFIPNAILITTCSSKHFLASFLSRDQAYDQMVELWKASRANSSTIEPKHDDDATAYSEEENRQSSLASLPLPKHLSSADEAARRRAVSEAGPRPNMQEYIKTRTAADVPAVESNPSPATQLKSKTECDCGINDQHFPTTVMDNKYDTTIETMYNLLYNSSFMNRFLCEVEKSTEVNIGEWAQNNGNIPYSRESSYIKFLGGSIGPKSTKCYLKEDVLHLDTTDYVSQLTTTQTPDVPAGGSFSVKTKTCISWSGQGQVRVLVTVLVEFTKSSWLKCKKKKKNTHTKKKTYIFSLATIEKATIDGQQNFYKSLDAAVRKYLAAETNKVPSRKKGGKRRHRKHSSEKEVIATVPSVPPNHFIIEMLCGLLNWLIDNVNVPNTSQLTAICMGMMVLTNIYIASKMSGVDKQLTQMGHPSFQQQGEYHYDDQDNNSLWRLLSKLDPDARKEDLKFVHQTRDPLPSSIKYQSHNNNEEESLVSDEHLQFSQMAKNKLDRQMMELEKMIQKAGQSMEQVTQVVQNQRKRILNPELK
ncbi:hypothetical protein INT48_005481 [Thamnidium elegans]|uniref:VASt domain-containing protein n=1 Tax=Thamnidium elegans TaxID=101142 RepID=A0A8H7SJ69_9FUNG|nr:hypothetical protein INT48_005481 [Thamnidium elegans]